MQNAVALTIEKRIMFARSVLVAIVIITVVAQRMNAVCGICVAVSKTSLPVLIKITSVKISTHCQKMLHRFQFPWWPFFWRVFYVQALGGILTRHSILMLFTLFEGLLLCGYYCLGRQREKSVGVPVVVGKLVVSRYGRKCLNYIKI